MVYFLESYKSHIQTVYSNKNYTVSDIVYNSRQTSEPVKVLPVGLDNNCYENNLPQTELVAVKPTTAV